MEWHRNEYTISTDRERLDLSVVHRYISEESYWGKGRSLEVVRKSVENSLPFGIYRGEELVGFARVVTDYATFAWLADVFILQEHRGRGLSKWLMEVILSHSELQGFRRWVLATKDGAISANGSNVKRRLCSSGCGTFSCGPSIISSP